jgi:hypothetical protein
MMECFGSAFHSEDALRGFCFNHFGDVHKTLKDTDRFFGIVRELICYCESRGRVTQLWDCLASENQAQYKQWFPRWSKAREKYRDSREAEYAEFRGSASPPRPDEDRSSSGHPLLSGNPETVSDWFFSDLDPSERGMVLATALFQGMNRTHLVAVAQSFGKLLGSPTDESVADGSTTE